MPEVVILSPPETKLNFSLLSRIDGENVVSVIVFRFTIGCESCGVLLTGIFGVGGKEYDEFDDDDDDDEDDDDEEEDDDDDEDEPKRLALVVVVVVVCGTSTTLVIEFVVEVVVEAAVEATVVVDDDVDKAVGVVDFVADDVVVFPTVVNFSSTVSFMVLLVLLLFPPPLPFVVVVEELFAFEDDELEELFLDELFLLDAEDVPVEECDTSALALDDEDAVALEEL